MTDLPVGFLKAAVRLAKSKENTHKPYLQGVLLTAPGKIVSTDGWCMMVAELPQDYNGPNVTLNADDLAVALKALDRRQKTVEYSDGLLGRIPVRDMSDEYTYPDWQRVMPKNDGCSLTAPFSFGHAALKMALDVFKDASGVTSPYLIFESAGPLEVFKVTSKDCPGVTVGVMPSRIK